MIRFILLCLLAGLISCTKTEETKGLTASDRERVTKEVRETLKAYADAVRQGGLMAEFNYLDDSDDFFWVLPGYESAISYDLVATIIKANAQMFTRVHLAYDSVRIVPLSKRLASYTGRVPAEMTDRAGNVTQFVLLETGILIKRADGWKLLSGQTIEVVRKK